MQALEERRWGTTAEQRRLVGTLGDIADRAEAAGIRPPATLVVGEVVRLRDMLNSFKAGVEGGAVYAESLVAG